MAHMLEETDNMFSVRELPWHGLGIVIDDAPNSEEAIKYAGLDWEVQQRPVFTNDENGNPITAEGYQANVRDTDNMVLGVVGKNYRPVQNKEAFDFTDALLGEGVKYETAGSLENGKRIWLLARMDGIKVLGDEVNPYLIFSNGHDGYTGIKVALTPIRVVCNNTLTLANDTAKRIWTTRHVGNMQDKLRQAEITLRIASEYLAGLEEYAEELAMKHMNKEEIDEFINTLMPIDEDETDRVKGNILLLHNELRARMAAPDLKRFDGTAWGVLNAVIDFSNHTKPRRLTAKLNENKLIRAIDGDELIGKAQKLLVA